MSEVFRLRKAALVSIVAGLISLSALDAASRCQEPSSRGGVQSFGFSSSWSGDSSHILIGEAEHRRIWTLGAEYTHMLRQGPRFRFDYEGSAIPLYEETDPTVVGTIFTLAGQSIITAETPTRVIYVTNAPVGTAATGNGLSTPIYALFGRQDTYAAAFSPLGARVSAFPRWHVQPSFALDLGFIVSARDIPVDQTDRFNYMFAFGPGVQFFTSPQQSLRFEYIYRHASNAGQGSQNPGVDQGVVRVTLSLHR
jgi:hypothetical protein